MSIGIVGSILLSVISNGLHSRLENFLDEKQIKRVIAELEKSTRSSATAPHMGEVYYNALDSHITKNDTVPFLIKICYDKGNPAFVSVKAFAQKEAGLFIEQNKLYAWQRNIFIEIFESLYVTTESALNKLNETERKISNTVKETEYNLSTQIQDIPSKTAALINSQPSKVLPDIPHYLTAQASPTSKEFSYRDDMVDALYAATKQNIKLALINGLGGIGKTTIAKALYHRVKDEYKHVAWVEYQHSIKDSLLNSFLLFNNVEDSAVRYRNIKNFLLNATADTIIFIDNVAGEDIDGAEFIEQLPVNVVLTSRADSIGNFKVFPVDFLSEAQCVDIFYKYYKFDNVRAQEATAFKLVRLVKCHTFSVELLARAANRPGYPLDTFASDLIEKGFEYPELKTITHHTRISQTVAEHLKTLFELVLVNDEQKRILKNFACMPSVEMPAEVEHWLRCTVNDVVGLTALGWLTMSETGYEMHPMVKEAIRLQYKHIEFKDFEAIIDYMSGNEYIKDTDIYTKVHTRLNIAESIMSCFCDVEKEEIGLLFNNIGLVYSQQGDYDKALKWHEKALAIREKVLGLEHPNTATSYNNIAAVYDNQGNYDKALKGYEKALAIQEKVLGLEHPDTANSYNNIATVYYNQGDYDKALKGCERALAIQKKVLGLEHPDTAISYNNVAFVLSRQGDYDKALKKYEKALTIKEKVLGLEHPSTANSYNNIATVYYNQGDYAKALKKYEKALAILEKVLGLEHSKTIAINEDIAIIKDLLSS